MDARTRRRTATPVARAVASGRAIFPLVILLAVAGALAAYWLARDDTAPRPPVPAGQEETPDAPAAERGAVVRHPVPADSGADAVSGRLADRLPQPLPELGRSDDPLQRLIDAWIDHPRISALLIPRDIVRRVVVTVDNLPRRELPLRHLPLQPPQGEFLAAPRGDGFVIDPANYRRYDRYTGLLEALDMREAAVVYRHFYPLLQEAYEELGYDSGYFNDRMVVAIEELLDAPAVEPPVALKRPAVRYIYADPALERRSAGQRLMLRMGPENAARVKRALREFRRELIAQ